jgi:hypothetical protein
LLRLGRKAKSQEQSASRKADDALAGSRPLTTDCSHRITPSDRVVIIWDRCFVPKRFERLGTF